MYIYAGIQVIYEKVVESGKETKYIGRVAKIEKVNGTETTTYFHTDHLGSTRGVTDSAGNLLTTLQYDPFGEVRSGSANGIKYTFTGKEQDATGLYYYGARFYDPKVGRFITKDLVAGDKKNPQTLNLHTYVTNNPINAIDPTGNYREEEGGNNARQGSEIIAADPTNGGITGGSGSSDPYNPRTPKGAGWAAGYSYYAVAVPNGMSLPSNPFPSTNIPQPMNEKQAEEYAENLGLNPSDAKEWAKGYGEGLDAAKEIFDSHDAGKIAAYFNEIGWPSGNIKGWNEMCQEMAFEIIMGYEWFPPSLIAKYPVKYAIWQTIHIYQYIRKFLIGG